ncbi:MAG: OsmC family protein [Rhodothermales bacterium]
MITRTAQAVWNDTLKRGGGTVRFGDVERPYSFASRFEQAGGTNPEELIGAAHAGCFSMALALVLGEDDHEPKAIRTTATVTLDPDQLAITKVELETEGEVPGLDETGFLEAAEKAKAVCPVSKALAGVEVVLKAARLAEPA